jgi:hypothetical protein
MTKVINDTLNDAEVNLIAYIFKTSEDHTSELFDTGLVENFRLFVANVAAYEVDKAKVTVSYVDYEPYANADNMRADIRYNKRLLISTLFNDSPLLGEDYNLKFRVAHDLHHSQTENCNFSLFGEVCAFTKFCAYTLPHQQTFRQILFSEIVGQVCYLRRYGVFPKQKTVLTLPPKYITRIMSAYGLKGY